MPDFIRNPLLIPELFQCILDCLLQTSTDAVSLLLARDRRIEKQHSLVALAQTCRATSEPSIDAIWRVLKSLEPLVWCSAGFSKQYEEDGLEDVDEENSGGAESDHSEYRSLNELEEMIPPIPSEWEVIRRHSHRVRELTVTYESFSLRFLRCIGSQQYPLFSNLRKLNWRPHSAQLCGSAMLIQPLLSPSLTELTATVIAEDDSMFIPFLNSYHLQCPNLKTISLEISDSEFVSAATIIDLSRAICHHEKLESAEVSAPIDSAALRHLALSPTLKVLSVVHHPDTTTASVAFHMEETPFPSVEHLCLTTSDLPFAASLLRPLHQIFHSFHLDLPVQPSANDFSTFFSELVSRSHKHPLRNLRFKFAERVRLVDREPTPEEMEVYCLSYQSFLPLTSLTFLRELHIAWKYPISLDDNELADIARSWPELQILSLDCGRALYATPVTKLPTFKGLLTLISTCPNLRSLSLPIDARVVPTDVDIDSDVTNTAIDTLHFPESPITEAQPVAEFLLKHFPSVRDVFTTFILDIPQNNRHMHAYNEIWVEVSSCVVSLRSQLDSE